MYHSLWHMGKNSNNNVQEVGAFLLVVGEVTFDGGFENYP